MIKVIELVKMTPYRVWKSLQPAPPLIDPKLKFNLLKDKNRESNAKQTNKR
jgi:hypothetical protein